LTFTSTPFEVKFDLFSKSCQTQKFNFGKKIYLISKSSVNQLLLILKCAKYSSLSSKFCSS
jgi:hypothetical protein